MTSTMRLASILDGPKTTPSTYTLSVAFGNANSDAVKIGKCHIELAVGTMGYCEYILTCLNVSLNFTDRPSKRYFDRKFVILQTANCLKAENITAMLILRFSVCLGKSDVDKMFMNSRGQSCSHYLNFVVYRFCTAVSRGTVLR
jgi:hypothetical protein